MNPLALAGLTATLLLAILAIHRWRQQSPVYLLSRYPKTPTFQRELDFHLKPSADRRRLVLTQSTFDRTLNSTTSCGLRADGSHGCWAGSNLWGSARCSQLSARQVKAIRSVTRAMPPTLARSAPENLLIVGFWQGGK